MRLSDRYYPGPWRAEQTAHAVEVFAASIGQPGFFHLVAKVEPDEVVPARDLCNGHLIAAAPELFEACLAVLSLLESLNVGGASVDQVRDAIARAKGEQP